MVISSRADGPLRASRTGKRERQSFMSGSWDTRIRNFPHKAPQLEATTFHDLQTESRVSRGKGGVH